MSADRRDRIAYQAAGAAGIAGTVLSTQLQNESHEALCTATRELAKAVLELARGIEGLTRECATLERQLLQVAVRTR